MSLSKSESICLFKLGFKRTPLENEIYPTDIYNFNGENWCLGGKLTGKSNLLVNDSIYKEGTWLPSLEDFIYWFKDNDCIFNISFDGNYYRVKVEDNKNNVYKNKGITIEFTMYKIILEILKQYNGNPIKKNYKVIDADYIKN